MIRRGSPLPDSAAYTGFDPPTSGKAISGGCRHAGLDNGLANQAPVGWGYAFDYTAAAPDDLGQVTSFTLSAQAVRSGAASLCSFFVDQTGILRTSSSGPAYADSPPLQ